MGQVYRKVARIVGNQRAHLDNRRISPSKSFQHPLLLLLGAKLPLMGVESFGLLNDIFPFPSILDAGYSVFNLHLANIPFDVILPSVLGSSL
jgi:hypothetical protein